MSLIYYMANSAFNKLAEITEEQMIDDFAGIASNSIATVVSSFAPHFALFSVFGTKVITKWTLVRVCHELRERRPTKKQCQKMDCFTLSAINTFIKLCQQSKSELNDSPSVFGDDLWEENAYEITENIYLKAANESQSKKLEILGAFFGREMFYSNHDWQELYFLTNLFSELSYRQIIMIKLLVENISTRAQAKEKADDLTDFNHESTYLEFQGLLYRGLFEVGEGSIGWASYNFSNFDFNSDIYTTDLAKEIYERFMLSEVNTNDVVEIKRSF